MIKCLGSTEPSWLNARLKSKQNRDLIPGQATCRWQRAPSKMPFLDFGEKLSSPIQICQDTYGLQKKKKVAQAIEPNETMTKSNMLQPLIYKINTKYYDLAKILSSKNWSSEKNCRIKEKENQTIYKKQAPIKENSRRHKTFIRLCKTR